MPKLLRRLKNYLFSLSLKQTLGLIFFVALLLLIPLTVYAVLTQRFDIRKQAAGPRDRIAILNNQLINIVQKRSPFLLKKRRISGEIIQEIALERKELLLREIKTDPEAFLQHTIPADIRQELSKKLNNQELFEQEVSIEGKMEVLHFDDFENKRSEKKYKVDKYNLQFTESIPHLLSGSIIKIKGLALDKELVVENKEAENLEMITAASPLPATGEQKIAVIMVKLRDNPREPTTEEELRSVVSTAPDSVKNYYWENSLNKLSFLGDIFGYYTIPYDDVDCPYYAWAEAADAAVREDGVPIDEYPRRIYVFWGNSCHYAAWATVGDNPSRSWITARGGPTKSDSYLHELGHNLDLWHANTLDCGDKSLGDFASDFSDCTIHEYGNYYDVMGASGYHNHFNVASKSFLQWFSEQTQIVTASGTYTLTPTEISGSGLKALNIPIPNTDKYYYLGYRKPIGFDQNLPSGITKGVSIYIWRHISPYLALLVDTTPNSKETPYDYYQGDFSDSALSDGQTFFDEVHGIKITQLSHNENSVTVSIQLPAPTPVPSPTSSPSPQPDLLVANLAPSMSSPTSLKIDYQLSNQGQADAPATKTYFYLDGKYNFYDEDPEIPAGQSTPLLFYYGWSCTGESHEMKLCADGAGTVQESDENNNCLEKILICPSPSPSPLSLPNLKMYDIKFYKPRTTIETTPKAGELVTAFAVMKNTGVKDTGVFNVKWFLNDEQTGYGSHANLPPDQESEGNVRFDWTPEKGTHYLRFSADVDGHVKESSEGDNQVVKQMVVE